jgi:hypothetical protein
MRKRRNFLIVLCLLLAMVPASAWADTIALGPPSTNWLQAFAVNSAGAGSSWNQLQIDIHGASLLGGIVLGGGSWTFSTSSNLILGSGPNGWNSTLYLGLLLLPLPNQPLFIDVFQFNNGTLMTGATTRLSWSGSSWSATNIASLTPTPVPEASMVLLMGVSALAGGVLRKRITRSG